MHDQVLFERLVGGCFYIVIPINPELEVEAAVHNTVVVEKAVKHMLAGKISPDELLEFVEPHVRDIDQYAEEVEENLSSIYLT